MTGIPRLLALAVAIAMGGRSVPAFDLANVLPELGTAPTPPSISEGLRLSYHVAVATVSGAYVNEFLENAGANADPELPNPSGRGITQVDVVGVTPQWTALRVQPWLFHNFTGPLVPLFGADECLISHAGGGDWYAHPSVLAKVQTTVQERLKIIRLPLRLGTTTFDALRVQTDSEAGRQVLCYDLQTGFLIYKAGATDGAQGATLSQATFIGSRLLTLPWANRLLPSWAAGLPQLRYEGTYTTVAPGPFPFSVPLSTELKLTALAPNWFVYDQTTTAGSLEGMPPTVTKRTLVSGIPHLAGLTLPSPMPAELTAGRSLDTDPITGATTGIAFVGTLRSGRAGVVIRMNVGDVAWSETAYDRDTGIAMELYTYSGASPVYYERSELSLVDLPPEPPTAPRVATQLSTDRRFLTLTWPTQTGTTGTLWISLDGARTWSKVPEATDRPGTGQTMRVEVPLKAATALYRIGIR
ncbi:MAG: hypothetical protein JNK85_01535 [Verrucomicrobiales bacterium]|nr:hypothetical protein [Verrucomicrobiales bacterium]